jgi:uncharacterized protein (TIGR03545 family)
MKPGLFKKGLFVIAGFLIVIAVVWFVVVDWAVKMAIESQGTKAVGARVDVAKADLSLFPAGIELLGLDVTNPDSPMTNALAVRRIFSDIELMPLIKGKIIIDNLRMEGIRLNTPRKSSGAVTTGKSADNTKVDPVPPWLDKMCAGDRPIQFAIPEVKDILAREKLQSLQLAQDLGAKIEAAKTDWQQRLKALPAQKDLETYKKRLDKIKTSGGGLAALMGSATELKTLNDDLQKDLSRLKKAKESYQTELDGLKQQTAQLTRAPLEDVRRLKAKYAISAEGLANLSQVLFGPSVCDWWQKGYHWYARLKPYIGGLSQKKTDKKAESAKPALQKGDLPAFLIRELHIDALLDTGNFTGEAADITSDPQIWIKPLTFKFLGRRMKQIQNVNMDGVLNFMQPGNPQHHVKVLVEKFALQNLDLSDAKDLPVSIANALADININFNLAGPKLDALAKAQLESVQMAVGKAVGSEISDALAQAVSSVTRFGLTAIVKGSDPDYATRIESDLDALLRKAAGQLVTKATAKLESQLQAAIAEKTEGPLKDARSQLAGLGDLTGEFTQRLNFGDKLLKEIKLPF